MSFNLASGSPLKSLSGHGDTVKLGDHVNIINYESGQRTVDARNVRITYLGENDLGYEPAFKDPRSSNTSCAIRGSNGRGLWYREFEIVRSQQEPNASEALVRPWITHTLLRFPMYNTPTKRLNKYGKQVADRVVLALCNWKWGVRMIRIYNPEVYYIRKQIHEGRVTGLELLTQTKKIAKFPNDFACD